MSRDDFELDMEKKLQLNFVWSEIDDLTGGEDERGLLLKEFKKDLRTVEQETKSIETTKTVDLEEGMLKTNGTAFVKTGP